MKEREAELRRRVNEIETLTRAVGDADAYDKNVEEKLEKIAVLLRQEDMDTYTIFDLAPVLNCRAKDAVETDCSTKAREPECRPKHQDQQPPACRAKNGSEIDRCTAKDNSQ
ncbi:hypothetical protein [Gloeobacter violaceus]|uniref:hypothetical protein n=1 Tax=Gloeobacter violaceus TaxID=33072 RepID=UPI0013E8CE3E|nr:hypothetical protein [Gloeobacter violaceus]